ncbi:MAG: polysaccharide deacetylase [Lachnospiraceae bacterium]|nr:polysaccharide deacetylase [Lachnospiraceae bacterium]
MNNRRKQCEAGKKNQRMNRVIAVMTLVLALLVTRLVCLEKEGGQAAGETAAMMTAAAGRENIAEAGEGTELSAAETAGETVYPTGHYTEWYPDMYVSKEVVDSKANPEEGDRPDEGADGSAAEKYAGSGEEENGTGNTGGKIAYLTFDDGPSCVTGEILDTLAQENIKATFFILGSTMDEEGEEMLKRMAQEGHTIGIHTYSHEYEEIYQSVESFLADFHKVYEQVVELTGVKPTLFRFPWGSYNEYCKGIKEELIKEMERRGFTYYDWNVSAEDSVGTPTEQSIIKNIKKDYTKYNQPVILMHDSMNNQLTARMLPNIIQMIRESGYGFDTLDHREPCQFSW